VPQDAPIKRCDLVMKGGVTSGVVYPQAITELSKQYRFSSIGGTSAGAIAAAVAAAAEYARQGGNPNAFQRVAELPGWFGEKSSDKHSRLFHLFQPQPSLAAVYGVVTAALGRKGWRKAVALVRAILFEFPIAAVVGLAVGFLIAWIASGTTVAWRVWPGYLASVFLSLLGLSAGILVAFIVQVRQIPRSGWGICSGMTEPSNPSPALVPWLADLLNQLAGKSPDAPLTFGDLEAQDVHLKMISTNLTNGRPYSIPFGEHTHFYFKGAELRRFFPESVVRWMETHPGKRSSRDLRGEVASAGLDVLPDSQDLPVVVAVRMSLSFPFLFCPVPLYGVDFRFGPKNDKGQAVPESCFFVDGGIANNFPLNLFDKPLPKWPTFGINLRTTKDGRHNQAVFMPCENSEGVDEWWTRFDEGSGFKGLGSFFSLLFDTSRNWRDNLQMGVPGYRDRVVHIGLDPNNEGGLNLDMAKSTIDKLTTRGREAGGTILSRYSPTAEYPSNPDCVVNLDNQKWIRFRSFMKLLEDSFLSMQDSYTFSNFGEANYLELIEKAQHLAYHMPDSQREYASWLIEAILELVPEIERKRGMGQSFGTRVPRPEPDLRVTPQF
jgi:predicted acylesterase/phospholipase RssA